MATWPQQQEGFQDLDVQAMQLLLNAHGAKLATDGDFGPLTTAAVKHFQASHGLAADGVVGDLTWPALVIEVKTGSTGDPVTAAQSLLNVQSTQIAVDGVFGPETDGSVRTFQGEFSLAVDGIVGPITWDALLTADNGAVTEQQAAQDASSRR